MKDHTTYKVGGPADCFIEAFSVSSLRSALKWSEGQPIFVIGNGSNLIVRDKGIRGAVIKPCFDQITHKGTTVHAQAGASIENLIKYTIDHELTGAEILTGIPATIGGAVCMNAGYMAWISRLVKGVSVMDLQGKEWSISAEEARFGYRNSRFLEERLIVTGVSLELKHGDCSKDVRRLKELRRLTQPIDLPSCGTVFKKNGLKAFQGLRLGDAEVRGSFIVNLGKATAEEIIGLISEIQNRSGGKLELEAEIVGEE